MDENFFLPDILCLKVMGLTVYGRGERYNEHTEKIKKAGAKTGLHSMVRSMGLEPIRFVDTTPSK